MIAMSIACEPSILIADEPTTALDVTVQAQILKLLSSLKEKRQMAMLFITHDIAASERGVVSITLTTSFIGSIIATLEEYLMPS